MFFCFETWSLIYFVCLLFRSFFCYYYLHRYALYRILFFLTFLLSAILFKVIKILAQKYSQSYSKCSVANSKFEFYKCIQWTVFLGIRPSVKYVCNIITLIVHSSTEVVHTEFQESRKSWSGEISKQLLTIPRLLRVIICASAAESANEVIFACETVVQRSEF